MPTLHPEFDLLFAAVDPVAGGLAVNLLAEAGIPALMQGLDFDVAELGVNAHNVLRRPDLYVPKGTHDSARAVLVEAWGESRVAQLELASR